MMENQIKGEGEDPIELTKKADQGDRSNLTVYTTTGTPQNVSIKNWREELALEFLRKAKETGNPETLYYQIMQSVRTGCQELALPFGEFLRTIDPNELRSTIALGILYSEAQQEDKAIELYLDYKKKNGDSPAILTNLAKLFKRKGKIDASRELIWESLQLDPNQDNAISWYAGTLTSSKIHYNPYLLDRIRRLNKAWLASIYLAKVRYEQQRGADGREILEGLFKLELTEVEAVRMFKRIVSELVILNLGEELVSIALPKYKKNLHGLETGFILIKALYRLNKTNEYEKLCRSLYADCSIDEMNKLIAVEHDLVNESQASKSVSGEENPHIDILMLDKPLWDDPQGDSEGVENLKGPILAIISGICRLDDTKDNVSEELTAKMSGISKIYTLLVGEDLQMTINADTHIIMPWIHKDRLGTIYVDNFTHQETPTGLMQPTEFEETFQLIREKKGTEQRAYSLNLLFGFYANGSLHKDAENKVILNVSLYQEKNWILLKNIRIQLDLDSPFDKVEEVISSIKEVVNKLTGSETVNKGSFYKPKESPNYEEHGANLLNLLRLRLYNNENTIGRKLFNPLQSIEQVSRSALKSKDKELAKRVLTSTIKEVKSVRPEIVRRFFAGLEEKTNKKI